MEGWVEMISPQQALSPPPPPAVSSTRRPLMCARTQRSGVRAALQLSTLGGGGQGSGRGG